MSQKYVVNRIFTPLLYRDYKKYWTYGFYSIDQTQSIEYNSSMNINIANYTIAYSEQEAIEQWNAKLDYVIKNLQEAKIETKKPKFSCGDYVKFSKDKSSKYKVVEPYIGVTGNYVYSLKDCNSALSIYTALESELSLWQDSSLEDIKSSLESKSKFKVGDRVNIIPLGYSSTIKGVYYSCCGIRYSFTDQMGLYFEYELQYIKPKLSKFKVCSQVKIKGRYDWGKITKWWFSSINNDRIEVVFCNGFKQVYNTSDIESIEK
jgi:hypothetical protein